MLCMLILVDLCEVFGFGDAMKSYNVRESFFGRRWCLIRLNHHPQIEVIPARLFIGSASELVSEANPSETVT